MPRAVQGEVAAARAGVQEQGNRRSTGFSAAFPLAAHTGKLLLPYRWSQTCQDHEFTPAQRHQPALSHSPSNSTPIPRRSQELCASQHLLRLRSSLPASQQGDRHRDKARGARSWREASRGQGDASATDTHPHSLSRALLLTPTKSHAPMHWERQPRRLSTQEPAGPDSWSGSAGYNTPQPASPGFVCSSTRAKSMNAWHIAPSGPREGGCDLLHSRDQEAGVLHPGGRSQLLPQPPAPGWHQGPAAAAAPEPQRAELLACPYLLVLVTEEQQAWPYGNSSLATH